MAKRMKPRKLQHIWGRQWKFEVKISYGFRERKIQSWVVGCGRRKIMVSNFDLFPGKDLILKQKYILLCPFLSKIHTVGLYGVINMKKKIQIFQKSENGYLLWLKTTRKMLILRFLHFHKIKKLGYKWLYC